MTKFQQLYYGVISRINNSPEEGQSTAEYSLVILGAAAIAMLLYSWATGTGSIGNLFESVVSKVTAKQP